MSRGDKGLVMVTGAGGQLGAAVCQEFLTSGKDDFHVLPMPHGQFDIGEPSHYNALADSHRSPTLVVNCAAYTQVAKAEFEPERAWAANSLGLSLLSEWCMLKGVKLIHISTDFVFGMDQIRSVPYHEDSPVGPVNAYGWSKLGGEYEIRKACMSRMFPHYIIRTAGVFADTHQTNFPHTIAKLLEMECDQPLEVIADVWTNLTRASDLARAIYWIATNSVPYGTYHIANPGETTWHQVAEVIGRYFGGRTTRQVSKETWRKQKGLDPKKAPNFTCLDLRRYQSLGGPELPNVFQALREWCQKRESEQ